MDVHEHARTLHPLARFRKRPGRDQGHRAGRSGAATGLELRAPRLHRPRRAARGQRTRRRARAPAAPARPGAGGGDARPAGAGRLQPGRLHLRAGVAAGAGRGLVPDGAADPHGQRAAAGCRARADLDHPRLGRRTDSRPRTWSTGRRCAARGCCWSTTAIGCPPTSRPAPTPSPPCWRAFEADEILRKLRQGPGIPARRRAARAGLHARDRDHGRRQRRRRTGRRATRGAVVAPGQPRAVAARRVRLRRRARAVRRRRRAAVAASTSATATRWRSMRTCPAMRSRMRATPRSGSRTRWST